jgi:hypothetical protein
MKESKFNLNQKSLSDADFEKAENFDEVLKGYNEAKGSSSGNGGGKSPLKWWLGGGAAVLAGLALLFMLNRDKDLPDTEQISKQELVAPPLDDLDVTSDQYNLIAENGGVISHNGSTITVPENAFLDSNGNVVNGDVEIRYREFHGLADIFISGIPMQYDSAGSTYTFESAGMFEIKAFKDGQELKTNPESLINVEMASKNEADYFNKYYLDETAGKWDYISKDSANRNGGGPFDSLNADQVAEAIQNVETSIKEILSAKPKKPVQRDPELYSIKIEVDANQFPELTVYGDVLFQVLDNDENFVEKYKGVDWDDVELTKNESGYLLTFYKDLEPHEFSARPVMDDQTYSAASADFDAKFEAFETRYGMRLEADSIAYAGLKARAIKITDSTNNINYGNSAEYQAQLASRLITGSITRSFTVLKFGTYNSDYPQVMPVGRMLAIDCFINKDNEKDTLEYRSLHMADHETNVLVGLSSHSAEELVYNPTHKTTFFMVTKDNKLAVFYPEDFKKLKDQETYGLELTVMEAPKNPIKAAEMLQL